MGLSGSIVDSVTRCKEQIRNLLSEYVVPSRALERISAKELLERTETKVGEVMVGISGVADEISLIRPDVAPVFSKNLASIERKFSSYIEVLKQDTINPAENTRLGLEQLRQTIADVSELLSHAEEASRSPDRTIGLVMDIVERGRKDISGNLTELEGDLQRALQERDYLRKRLEEVDYVVSGLRAEKASLEKEISNLSAQIQISDEESKKWKQEALSNSFRSAEELFSQLKAQVEGLRAENERLKLMARLERARYFALSQQTKEPAGT
jgi:chromosome segregation ATPase